MAYTAAKTAHNASVDNYNPPGYCLAQVHDWAGIGAKYATASQAWYYNTAKHRDAHAPRGSAVYWTGGSHGYGHIAISLGNGMIRSTDAGGWGRVATVPLSWIHTHWGLTYAGWSWQINGQT